MVDGHADVRRRTWAKSVVINIWKNLSLTSEQSWPVALSVSYIGYQPRELVLERNESPLSIRLEKLGGEHIEETVVIGYGKSSREKLTSSVVKVSGTKLVQQPIQNPVAGLQGMVAGLYMTMGSGNLGAQPTILIRGDNTIMSSSNPLYIIDGVPMPSSGINSNRIGGATGVLSPFINLNAADIESIEVLKDADATAIYGTRGANGVILITSKTGKAGPTRVSFDFYRGTTQAVNKMDRARRNKYSIEINAMFFTPLTVPLTPEGGTMAVSIRWLLWFPLRGLGGLQRKTYQ